MTLQCYEVYFNVLRFLTYKKQNDRSTDLPCNEGKGFADASTVVQSILISCIHYLQYETLQINLQHLVCSYNSQKDYSFTIILVNKLYYGCELFVNKDFLTV